LRNFRYPFAPSRTAFAEQFGKEVCDLSDLSALSAGHTAGLSGYLARETPRHGRSNWVFGNSRNSHCRFAPLERAVAGTAIRARYQRQWRCLYAVVAGLACGAAPAVVHGVDLPCAESPENSRSLA
jgi:hypothetical protein